MQMFEIKLLQAMVNKMVNDYKSVHSVVMTVIYSDGIADTFEFGNGNAGVRTEIVPLLREEE